MKSLLVGAIIKDEQGDEFLVLDKVRAMPRTEGPMDLYIAERLSNRELCTITVDKIHQFMVITRGKIKYLAEDK